MNTYTIQKATVAHSDLIAKMICDLLRDLNERSGSNFDINQSKIEVTCRELLARNNFAGFIASENETNQAIGMITIAQATAIYNGGDFGVITELFVDRSLRSNGVGKTLIDAALGFAREQHWDKVEVGAPNKAEWPRTIEFYKQNGFEEKGPKLRIALN